MRTRYEEDEELDTLHRQEDRELTLSSTTLLFIFFGLVLVCGLFFGLGYTLGRRAPFETKETSAAVSAPATAQSFDSQSKPSAAAHTEAPATSIPASTPSPQGEDTSTSEAADEQQTVPVAAPAVAKPALNPEPQPRAKTVDLSKYALAQPGAIVAAASTTMVQIAAVSNPVDADVLVSALHKHGYTVTVRREPNDMLMHVQIGPFSSRAEAIAMRQKLLSDGYNAILK